MILFELGCPSNNHELSWSFLFLFFISSSTNRRSITFVLVRFDSSSFELLTKFFPCWRFNFFWCCFQYFIRLLRFLKISNYKTVNCKEGYVFPRSPFGPNSGWGTIETTAIGRRHPTLTDQVWISFQHLKKSLDIALANGDGSAILSFSLSSSFRSFEVDFEGVFLKKFIKLACWSFGFAFFALIFQQFYFRISLFQFYAPRNEIFFWPINLPKTDDSSK